MLLEPSGESEKTGQAWQPALLVEAIAVENIRDWAGILDYTQLTRETLNTAISELYTLEIIIRR